MKRIFAVLISLVALQVQAQTYQARSDCLPLPEHKPSADVNATAGLNAKGEAVASPDLQPSRFNQQFENVGIGVNIPLGNYVGENTANFDTSRADIQAGQLQVNTRTGDMRFNGEAIPSQESYPNDCVEKHDASIYSTK